MTTVKYIDGLPSASSPNATDLLIVTQGSTGTAGSGVVKNITLAQLLAAPAAIGGTTPSTGVFTTLRVGSTSGPTWTSGTGAPAGTQPNGSLYSRTDGTTGARLYVSNGSTWAAVSGV